MSPLASAVLDFAEVLHRETGEDPKRIVVPERAYAILWKELSETCFVPPNGDPISGPGSDGRLWLACTEIVPDQHKSKGDGE